MMHPGNFFTLIHRVTAGSQEQKYAKKPKKLTTCNLVLLPAVLEGRVEDYP